jgi:menaquinol-cytochrome c reductase iron-sulfur subunit
MQNKATATNQQPPKGADASKEDQDTIAGMDRRQFLMIMSYTLGGLAATLIGVPIVGFLLSPFLRRPPEVWRPVGRVDDFRVGSTSHVILIDPSPLPWAGVTSRTAAWLRRESHEKFIAYSVDCTHLGCPVRWLPDANLFMCPCHGGVFNQVGVPVAGPPPKPLVTYPVRVNNGVVEVQTSPLPITT